MTARGSRKHEYADDPITARAAAFFEHKRFGDWSEADQAELDAWLSESILHEVAFLRLAGHATRAERLGALRPFRRDAHAAAIPFGWFVIPALAAASFALVKFGVPLVALLMAPQDRNDATDIGGRTLLSFSDKTQIELNTDTALRVRMTTAERTVWLEKGEAWFHVSHDAAHPFTVFVGGHRITDLGTDFLVRRNAGDVSVTLLTGSVSLSGGGSQSATLSPGEEAVATPASLSVTRKTPQEISDELAWRSGMLVFRDTSLTEVVKEFNRYNATKLMIADPAIADKRITINVRTDDVESFLRFAQDALKLRINRKGGAILISRGQPEETRKAMRLKRKP